MNTFASCGVMESNRAWPGVSTDQWSASRILSLFSFAHYLVGKPSRGTIRAGFTR